MRRGSSPFSAHIDFRILALAAVLVMTIQYWLGPIIVRLTQRYPVRPRFLGGDPAKREVPAAAEAFFQESEVSLAREGFEPLAFMTQHREIGALTTCILLFENAAASDLAIAVATMVPGKQVTRLHRYVEFASKFEDDSEVDTSNTPIFGAFPARLGKTVLKLEEPDAGRLYQVHKEAVRQLGGAPKKRMPADANPVTFMEDAMARDLKAQLASGYLYQDGDCYRPTWKGAAFMCWKLLWPWKVVLKREMEERVRPFV